MSDSLLFDTLRYVDQLIEAGVPEQQAKAHARGLVQLVESQFATRADMRRLDHKIDGAEQRLSLTISGVEERLDARINGVEHRLDAKIDSVEQRLDAKISGVEERLDAKIDGVEKSLTAEINGRFETMKWTLGLMIAAFGILTSVLSVLH